MNASGMTHSGMRGEGGLSHCVARRIVESDFAALSSSTIHACKRAIIDGVATLLAGSSTEESAAFVDMARQMEGHGSATVFGYGERTSPLMAALCNGAMAHALDFEDAFDPVPLHPNASLLPAAFAASEYSAAVSGRDFITAVAVGCDLACRVGLSLRRPLESGGWYPPPIVGAFGALAACARLLHLTADQVVDACSLLLLTNCCPGEIKHSARTVLRAVREAFPAQSALQAVMLASRGVLGFERPLEGVNGFFNLFAGGQYDPGVLLDTTQPNNIERLSFKRWPCCRGTHAFIESIQQIRRAQRLNPHDIARIELTGAGVHRMLVEPLERKRRPETLIDAKFSLPFTVAMALLVDEITLDCFTTDRLRDTSLLDLAGRCVFVEAAPGAGYAAVSGHVCLVLHSGARISRGVQNAAGDPSNPLSDSDLCEKFIDCAARSRRPLERAQALAVVDHLMTLEHRADVGALVELFQRPGPAVSSR